MKLIKYSPLILGLIAGYANSQIIQEKPVKEKSKKTILLPPKEFYNAWITGSTLAQYVFEVNGPLNLDLKAFNGKDTINAYITPASLDKVLKIFERENPALRRKGLRKELSKYPTLDIKPNIFSDGKVISEEELKLLGNLPDGKYIVPFFYISDDKKASLPGIFMINKYGDNFSYKKRMPEEEIKKDILEPKADTLTTRPEAGKPDTNITYKPKEIKEETKKHIPEKPDTTKKEYIPKDELDYLRQKGLMLDSLYKVLLEKQKLSKITPLEKEDLEKIIEEREKISELIEKKEAKKFDIGLGYDNDNFYSLESRQGNGFKLGIGFGYSPSKTRNIISPVINNFYGEGSEKTESYFIGPSFGIDISKYLTLNLILSLSIKNKTVQEYIKRSNGIEVARNKDNYDDKKLRSAIGLDFNLGSFGIGPRMSYDRNKWYAGLMARLRL